MFDSIEKDAIKVNGIMYCPVNFLRVSRRPHRFRPGAVAYENMGLYVCELYVYIPFFHNINNTHFHTESQADDKFGCSAVIDGSKTFHGTVPRSLL